MYTYYSLNEIVKSMVLRNMSLEDICDELNFDRKYVITVLKGIKSDILMSYNCNDFYVLELIDRVLYKDNKIKHTVCYVDNDKRNKILNLIDDGVNGVDILNVLNIDEKELLFILKSIYYESIRDKNINININLIKKATFEIIDYLKKRNTSRNKSIITKSNEKMILEYDGKIINTNSMCQQVYEINEDNEFKFIVISDTHFGSVFENIEYLDFVYEYASINNIKYILHAGDLIEGSYDNYGRCKSEYSTIDSQINHVLKDFCYDDNIKNMILLANHDVYSIYHYGIDIAPILEERKDFEILGYRSSYLKVNDKYISLKHEISRLRNSLKDYITLIDFVGHSHQYRCNYNKTNTRIKVPTLSDMKGNYIINKGFLVCNINSNDLKVSDFDIKYIDFEHPKRDIILTRTLKK